MPFVGLIGSPQLLVVKWACENRDSECNPARFFGRTSCSATAQEFVYLTSKSDPLDPLHYLLLIDGLLLVAGAVVLRHLVYRTRYHLHMVQLLGYKVPEVVRWQHAHLRQKMLPLEYILFSTLLVALLLFTSPGLTLPSVTVVLTMSAFAWFGSVARYRPEREKKPLVHTPRMVRLEALTAALLSLLVLTGGILSFTGRLEVPGLPLHIREAGVRDLIADPYLYFFTLMVSDLLSPWIITASALLLQPVEKRIQEGFKREARERIRNHPSVKVIAITGSFGKTSTKFMISTLLEERFQVCTTPGSFNTPMGICKVVNQDLRADHRFLILEMGARYAGNIEELCDIATPDISVVTSVGPAHLETFGSLEVIAREKGALARRLNPGGTLVLNAKDPIVATMGGERMDVKVILTGDYPASSVRASSIRYTSAGCEFDLHLPASEGPDKTTNDTSKVSGSVHPIRLPVLGEHAVQNFLLAAAVAWSVGLRGGTIAAAASRIRPVPHRLELKQRDGRYILDDAFNSNPFGAKSALDVLDAFTPSGATMQPQGADAPAVRPFKKVLVTPGMVELGERQEEYNRLFGEQIASTGIDHILLVGRQQTAPIQAGIRAKDPDRPFLVVSSLFEANEWIQRNTSPGDVILYENDLPDTFNE